MVSSSSSWCYVPLLAFTGVEGKTFEPMAPTVIIALAKAFVISLTFVPAATAITLNSPVRESENLFVRRLKEAYAPILSRSIAKPGLIVAAAAVLFTASLVLFKSLGQEFTPTLDEKNIVMEVKRVPSTALSHAQAMQLEIEKVISKFPQVGFVFSRTGSPDLAADPMPPSASDTYIIVKPQSEPDSSMRKDDPIRAIDEEATNLPGHAVVLSASVYWPVSSIKNSRQFGPTRNRAATL